MDLMGWGLAALAGATLAGILVVGLLGAIALRRCREGDIPVVLDRITKLVGAVGRSGAAPRTVPPGATRVTPSVEATAGEES